MKDAQIKWFFRDALAIERFCRTILPLIVQQPVKLLSVRLVPFGLIEMIEGPVPGHDELADELLKLGARKARHGVLRRSAIHEPLILPPHYISQACPKHL
ncbi:hypothetical protein B5F73_08660 [Olsenella sp. An270]|nr:hypothetical protein B5F73_08660 [Olsenella sp. An270]